MKPEEKTIKELIEKGYSTLKSNGYNDSENPDAWRLFEIWIGVGQKKLYLSYEWRKDNYHFYFYKNRKEAIENRAKVVGSLDDYNVEKYLKDQYPFLSLAKKAARTVASKKHYYYTEKADLVNEIMANTEDFSALTYWFQDKVNDIVFAYDSNKPLYIIGEYMAVFSKLKRMGYKTHIEDEIEEFDDISLNYM